MRAPKMENTVKPYDTDWNALLRARDSVASPTCMAVKTMVTKPLR